jgi:hypothetical protein
MNRNIRDIIFLVPRYHTNLEPIVQGLLDNGYELHIYPWRKSIAEIRIIEKKLIFEDEKITKILKLVGKHLRIYRAFNMLKILNDFKKTSRSVRIFVRCETSLFGIVSLFLILASGMRKNTTIYTQYPIIHPRLHQSVWVYILTKLLSFKYFSQVLIFPDKSRKYFDNIDDYRTWLSSELKSNVKYIPFAIPLVGELRRAKSGKIVSVGKAEVRKGLIEIVEVFRELWTEGALNKTLDLVVQVHDKSHEAYLSRLKIIASDLIAGGQVRINVNLDTMQTREIIATSEFLILNSHDEPASFVQYEALSLRIPFILNRSNGNSFLLPDGLGIKKIDSKTELKMGILEMAEYLNKYENGIDKLQAVLSIDLSGTEVAKRWLKV